MVPFQATFRFSIVVYHQGDSESIYLPLWLMIPKQGVWKLYRVSEKAMHPLLQYFTGGNIIGDNKSTSEGIGRFINVTISMMDRLQSPPLNIGEAGDTAMA